MIDFIGKGLTRKMVLLLLVLSLVPMFILSMIGYQMSEQMRSDFLGKLEQQFDEKVLLVDGSIKQRIFEMEVLSHHILFQELTSDLPNVQVQDIDDELSTRYLDYAERTAYVDTILEVKVFDNDGMELFSLYNTHLGTDYTAESIDTITDTQIIFDFDEKLGRIVKAEAPIMSKDNSQRLGLLLFVTDMRNFDSILLDRSGLKETGEAYFVNTEKIMASESRFIEDAAFNQKVDTFGVRQCLENNSEVRGDFYPDYRGEPIIGYSKCILEYGIVLLVEADIQELTFTLDVFRNQFVGVLVSAGVAVFFISIAMGRKIARPVTKLSHFANQLANENFDVKLDLKEKDEIGQLVKNMRDMGTALKKAKKHKDEFAAMISHELKNPLTPIKIYATALKRPKMLGELNKKQMDAVDGIHFNALRLEGLIGDLLDVQKLEIGRMKFENKWIVVEEFMAMITKNLKSQTEQKGGQLINHTKGKIIMKSDTPRLSQVFSNLINNSIDFIPKNKGKIEINAQKKDGKVLFSVKDNGLGMTLETQKNLFQKFYQADTSITRKHGGTGLGLAICKGIVEGLGGKIWLESEVGKGTNVYFTIPRGTLDENIDSR